MNIFEWIYEGRYQRWAEEAPRMAALTYRLPTAVVDDEHAEVDAMAPELAGLARDRKEPWLEVFARHWHLQSLVFKRLDVREAMGEAVALVERAHRPDAIGCPQSVCATQDLCAAYGYRDGPAFVPERLEASQGTLDRIDPSWPCWRCISAEYASALLDADRPADALAWLEDNLAKMRAVNPETDRSEYAGSWVRALAGLGRLDEAMALNAEAKSPGGGAHFVHERAVERAWLLSLAGRHAEAVEALPAWDGYVRDTPAFYDQWSAVASAAVLADALPLDRALFEQWAAGFRLLAKNTAAWHAWRVGLRLAECMLHAGWLVADAQIDALEAVSAQRRVPGVGAAQLEVLRARWQVQWAAAQAEVVLPDTPEAAHQQFVEAGASFATVREASIRWPDAARFTRAVAGHWRAMGFTVRSEAVLRAYVARNPDDPEGWRPLAEQLLDDGQFEALDALLVDYAGVPAAQRLAAQALHRRGRPAAAMAALDAYLAACPEDAPAWAERGEWRRAAGELEGALADYDAAIAAGLPVGAVDWSAAIAATRLGDWARVRAAAHRLGMTLSSDSGPIEERWELVRVRYDEPGPRASVYAVRLGPVHARVLQADGPDHAQRQGDVVVFDARPLNPEVEREERPIFEYAVDEILLAADRQTFVLDGVHPGPERLDAVTAAVADLGGSLQVLSGDTYQLTDPETEAERLGIYAVITAPPGAAPEPFGACLRAHLADQPLVWPELADEADAARHAEIAAAWSL